MAASSSVEPPNMSIFTNYYPQAVMRDTAYADHGLFEYNYEQLLSELQEIQDFDNLINEDHKDTILNPFIAYLLRIGDQEFNKLMKTHNSGLSESERFLKAMIRDVSEALLHRNQNICPLEAFKDLQALQALASDIHFTCSSESASGIPPLVVWTKERGKSPYTLPRSATKIVDLKAGIICFPPHYRHAGLLAWSSMGHEVAGHDFLRTHDGLVGSLRTIVRDAVENDKDLVGQFSEDRIKVIAEYLSAQARIDELASDVLGVLRMGPSSVIGSIGFLRSIKGGLDRQGPFQVRKTMKLTLTWGEREKLVISPLKVALKNLEGCGVLGRSSGSGPTDVNYLKEVTPGDAHPVDILRPYVMLSVIRLLNIHDKIRDEWLALIEWEMGKEIKDIKDIRLLKAPAPVVNGSAVADDSTIASSSEETFEPIPFVLASLASEIAAKAIAETPLGQLESKSLINLVCWNDYDELLTSRIKETIHDKDGIPTLSGLDSRHIVAGSILASLEREKDLRKIFENMKEMLIEQNTTERGKG